MASSSMVAVWEARAEQEVAELAKNTNTRKQSTHRPRLGSNRRKGNSGVSAESIESLDDILLRWDYSSCSL